MFILIFNSTVIQDYKRDLNICATFIGRSQIIYLKYFFFWYNYVLWRKLCFMFFLNIINLHNCFHLFIFGQQFKESNLILKLNLQSASIITLRNWGKEVKSLPKVIQLEGGIDKIQTHDYLTEKSILYKLFHCVSHVCMLWVNNKCNK